MTGKALFTGRDDEISLRSRSRPRARLRRGISANRLLVSETDSWRGSGGPEHIGNGYGDGYGNEATTRLRPRDSDVDRGTSLIELLVVLALLSVMVLVGAQLVVHSMELLGATGRAVRNPLVVHVTSRLRHDVQEAAGLQQKQWVWSEDPLILVNQDGSFTGIALENGNLVRTKAAGLGSPPESRVILRGVAAWWWRNPVEGVVDLNITYLVNPEPERQASRDVGFGLERRQENLRFAIRGGGGGTRW